MTHRPTPLWEFFQAAAVSVKQCFRCGRICSALLKGEATAYLAGIIAYERTPGVS